MLHMNTAANSNKSNFRTQTAGQVRAFMIIWLLSIAAILGDVRAQIRQYSYDKAALSAVLIAFALRFALYWIPGFPAIRKRFELRFSPLSRAFVAGGLLIIPYIIYGAGTGSLSAISVLKLIAIAGIALGVYAIIPPDSQAFSWQDLIVMLVIVVPMYTGWYRDIWPVPVYLDVMARLFVVSLAASALLSVRLLEGVGYVWRIQAGDWVEGAKQLVFFSVIGLPLGFFLRFIVWRPRNENISAIAFSFVGIFLFIAIAEELFFRGMLQNLLEKSLKNKYVARGIASAVFGFSHIYHGFPNWRYVLMAAIAGWFYGTAWHNRRSIMASSVTHAAVDALWRHFLLA
jgi:membrane protease YdiL (CAAX protease family)